jgi:hypothetical protein
MMGSGGRWRGWGWLAVWLMLVGGLSWAQQLNQPGGQQKLDNRIDADT